MPFHLHAAGASSPSSLCTSKLQSSLSHGQRQADADDAMSHGTAFPPSSHKQPHDHYKITQSPSNADAKR